jgi:hypothetical protein
MVVEAWESPTAQKMSMRVREKSRRKDLGENGCPYIENLLGLNDGMVAQTLKKS